MLDDRASLGRLRIAGDFTLAPVVVWCFERDLRGGGPRRDPVLVGEV